jgi:hypothetical protein
MLYLLEPVFNSGLWLFDFESRELYPACVRYHYQDEVEPYSSVMASHVIGFHHFLHEVSWGVLYVCVVSLKGFTIERR